MRISKLETFHADGGWRVFSYLKVTTDEGLVGWSEYAEGFGAGGLTELLHRFANVVKGMDPRTIGKISASLQANTRLAAGGLNAQAIGAIENACLDIKAKALGIPVYELFGGPYRERLPLYWSHCASFRVWQRDFFEEELGLSPIRTVDDVADLGREAVARGFRAIKTNPLPLWPGSKPFNAGFRIGPDLLERRPMNWVINEMKDVLGAFRSGIGPDTALMFDLNFSQRTEGFVRIARALEEFNLTWLEIDIHDADALAYIRAQSNVPIASLEAIHGLHNYRPYLAQRAADVAVVDVVWNGMLEATRIATLADAYETDCAPHNFYGDLASLMSAHFCAAIPNFRIMEIEVDDVPWKSDLVTNPPVIENGELIVPQGPGWGTEVNEDALKEHPPRK